MKKFLKNATMGNMWKVEISRTILNIFRPYNGIDVFKLPFLEELCEKKFVVSYVSSVSTLDRRDTDTAVSTRKKKMKPAPYGS